MLVKDFLFFYSFYFKIYYCFSLMTKFHAIKHAEIQVGAKAEF